jgi:hypothetical protein
MQLHSQLFSYFTIEARIKIAVCLAAFSHPLAILKLIKIVTLNFQCNQG